MTRAVGDLMVWGLNLVQAVESMGLTEFLSMFQQWKQNKTNQHYYRYLLMTMSTKKHIIIVTFTLAPILTYTVSFSRSSIQQFGSEIGQLLYQ